MIRLTDLYLETLQNSKSPKLIFITGAPGSGKSYILNQLSLTGFTTVNIDDVYEKLIKSSGLELDQTKYSSDDLSKVGTLMSVARKITTDKLDTLLNNKKNIIIDGTGGSSKEIQLTKQKVEEIGYKTFMISIYVSSYYVFRK